MPTFTLKHILAVDAATCLGVFAVGIFATAFAAGLLGLPAGVVSMAGWICLAAAMPMLFLTMQAQPNRTLVTLIALGNLGWVAASFAVLAIYGAQMTAIGMAILVAQAIGVLVFAILEARTPAQFANAQLA